MKRKSKDEMKRAVMARIAWLIIIALLISMALPFLY